MKINSKLFNILEVQDTRTKNVVYISTLLTDIPVGVYVLYYTDNVTLEQIADMEYNKTLQNTMTINPNKIHTGCVLNVYPIGKYNKVEEVTGVFMSCICTEPFYDVIAKQQSYDTTIKQLEQKRQMFQERQLYAMMAQYDPEAQVLLRQLDNITGYVDPDIEVKAETVITPETKVATEPAVNKVEETKPLIKEGEKLECYPLCKECEYSGFCYGVEIAREFKNIPEESLRYRPGTCTNYSPESY